jgi:hypothetical protein
LRKTWSRLQLAAGAHVITEVTDSVQRLKNPGVTLMAAMNFILLPGRRNPLSSSGYCPLVLHRPDEEIGLHLEAERGQGVKA